MRFPFATIDAFSDTEFGGVPVTVFLDAERIPEAYFPALTEETCANNTVFISGKTNNASLSFDYYNEHGRSQPGAHALIAGLAALHQSNKDYYGDKISALKIITQDDALEAYIDTHEQRFPYLLKQIFRPEIDCFVPTIDDIADIIGLQSSDIVEEKYNTLISSVAGQPYLIVPLKSYHAVRRARFQKPSWSASSLPASLIDRILLFAPNTDISGADLHVRLLKKQLLAGADPAIGEAVPAFAAYLCQQAHVQKGTHSITLKRGANEQRQSFVHLELDNHGDKPSMTIRIGGAAVVSARGEILIRS